MWQGKHCPNNRTARLIATAHLGLARQVITRHTIFLVISLCSLYGHHFCSSFLLLDILFIHPTLQNIVLAVSIPKNQLGLTGLVGIIVMFNYAAIAFYYLRPDYEGNCESMLDCTVATIYNGMRTDIGS